MLRKKAAAQFFWMVAFISFLAVALTGDSTPSDFGYGVLAGVFVLLAGYAAIRLFWQEEDE